MFRWLCFSFLSFYFYKYAIYNTFVNVFYKYNFALWEPSFIVAMFVGSIFYFLTND